MTEHRKSSRFESLLFGITRVLAICSALVGFIALGLAIQSFLTPTEDTHVSLDDINTEPVPEGGSVSDARAADSEPALARPPILEKYFTGSNSEVLEAWLEGLSDSEQKQDFVDNLAEVVAAAEQKDLDVANVINNYKTIKLSKLAKSEFERYAEMGRKGGLLGAMLGIVLFISLMTLVLVMLAIERNTRVNRS